MDEREFYRWLQACGYAKSTQGVFVSAARMFEAFCAQRGLAVDAAALEQYKAHVRATEAGRDFAVYGRMQARATAIRAYLRFLRAEEPARWGLDEHYRPALVRPDGTPVPTPPTAISPGAIGAATRQGQRCAPAAETPAATTRWPWRGQFSPLTMQIHFLQLEEADDVPGI